MTGKAASVDWEAVEADYRVGIKTLRQIATEHDITEGAVRKRAKRDGWERDLAAKVRAKAEALVRKQAVRKEVRNNASEREIVAANAEVAAGVDIRHREDLVILRNTAIDMLAELRVVGEHVDTLDEIAKLLAMTDEGETNVLRLDRMREALRRACSLPGRVTAIKALAETITKLIDTERTAWKLDDPINPGTARTLTDLELASKLAYFVDLGRRRRDEYLPPAVDEPQVRTLQ
jgi:hypothetical protein